MIFRLFSLLCALTLAASMTACAIFKGKPTLPQPTEIQQQLYNLQHWKLDGRIAVKSGDEGWNANLTWDHGGEQDRLLISGPFSQGAVSIIMQSGLITINESNGEVSTSRDPDDLLKQKLGFSVPLPSLRYWVLGVPAPDIDFQAIRDAEQHVQGFKQQDWVLTFDSYEKVSSFSMPQKITAQGSSMRLRLVVDEWVLQK